MSEHQHISFFQIWLDVLFIKIRLLLIVDQDHDDIRLLCSFGCCKHFKALIFRFFP